MINPFSDCLFLSQKRIHVTSRNNSILDFTKEMHLFQACWLGTSEYVVSAENTSPFNRKVLVVQRTTFKLLSVGRPTQNPVV